MPATAAQIAANRRNSERSTGPKSAGGKERSRANALKHGLTGDGVVSPPDEAAAVARRAELLEGELRPSGELGRILVRRVALLSHRMERCAEQELAATARRVRSAAADFEEERRAALDGWMARLEAEPATAVRQLSRSPEGVERLVEGWLGLLDDLEHPGDCVWEEAHWRRAEALAGRAVEAFPVSPLTRWHLASEGKPGLLLPEEVRAIGSGSVRDWARLQIAEQIAREVDRLGELAETLENSIAEADRLGAADRARFDPSREATLARRYEASAERGMYRALRELREHEAEIAGGGLDVPADPTGEPRGTLASFFPPRMPQAGRDEPEPELAPDHRAGAVSPADRVTAGRALPGSTGTSSGR